MANDKAKALSAILEKKDTDVIAEHLTVASREARMRFGKIVENARTDKNQFVITEHGEPAAALIPISDLRILDWMKRHKLKDYFTNAAYGDWSVDELVKEFRQEPYGGQGESGGADEVSDRDYKVPAPSREVA